MPKCEHWLSAVVVIFVFVADAEYLTDCVLPNGVPGICVPLHGCSDLLRMAKQLDADNPAPAKVSYLKSRYCGYHNRAHHVCCADDQLLLNASIVDKLANAQCGVFELRKIAGGQQVRLSALPWMVLLKYNTANPFRCGGTLISDRYVLTAAHCIVKNEDSLVEVRLGEHNISSVQDCVRTRSGRTCAPPVEDIGIEKMIVHHAYHRGIHHDIALLRLNRTVQFQDHIKPICLPITEVLASKTFENYIVAGWGNTENGNSSDVLLWANVPSRGLEVCNNEYRKSFTRGHICAGGEDLVDSCKGDSGGPLLQLTFYTGRKLRLIQFGVVSLGVNSCGVLSKPAIYTNVARYMQWITDNMEP